MRDLQSKLIPMFFLQPKSPASFYGGSNLTVALRQDRAQVIMRMTELGIISIAAEYNGKGKKYLQINNMKTPEV